MRDPVFCGVERALEEFRKGRIVIVVDDEERENEGDFIMAAQACTPAAMNLLIRRGSGFVCAPTTDAVLERLQIPMMVQENTSPMGTAMTVTIDAKEGTTTGVSAGDRCQTVRLMADPSSRAEDFSRPGHIVPLRARKGGVLRRAGHTEAAVDLCYLAGLPPVGVLAEVMNEDGSMARMPELIQIAEELHLKIVTIAELIAYRRTHERLVNRVATTFLPTRKYGDFTVYAYESVLGDKPAIALVKGKVDDGRPCLVRVHSSCTTGDLLDSLRCDCGQQLELALQAIAKEGRGVLIYLEQEGRGIGLINKMKAYELQDQGQDTVQANRCLGFKPDLRDYGIGAQIMLDLGLREIRFMTNNPSKVKALDGYGIKIVEWVGLMAKPNRHNIRYLRTKKKKMNHRLPDSLLSSVVE